MNTLPKLRLHGKDYRLPLFDETARSMVSALLTDEESTRIGRLASAMEADANLLLWACGQAQSSNSGDIHSAHQAARWLATRLTVELVGIKQDAPETSQPKVVAAAVASDFAIEVASRAETEINSLTVDSESHDVANLVSLVGKLGRLQQLTDRFDDVLLQEKLASLKEFSYGASHELNNPLFNISSRAQLLLRDEADPQRRKKLATIHSHAIRASEMIRTLALFAHPPKPSFVELDIVSTMKEVVEELAEQAAEAGCQLNIDQSDPTLFASADNTQIAVCVRELLLNSIEAISRSGRVGRVDICARVADKHPGEPNVEITVRDDGPGLDTRASRHLFDPYFSGYEAGRGLGMGLPKCWQIMQAHSGHVAVESRPGRGTSVVLAWPQTRAAESEKTTTVASAQN